MKSIKRIAKLQFAGSQAKPGPALASLGINIMAFCNQFNTQTQNRANEIVPVEITIFTDKTFTFVLKTTPVTNLIKKAANLEKGAATTVKGKPIATLSENQVIEIAKYKMIDLNTTSLEAAKRMILGTMKQMGVEMIKTPGETTKNETNNETP